MEYTGFIYFSDDSVLIVSVLQNAKIILFTFNKDISWKFTKNV